MMLRPNLDQMAEQIGIHEIAVCHAGRFEDVWQLLMTDHELGIVPPFTEENIEKRVDPACTMADAGSFIVILEGYKPEIYKPLKGMYGNISPAAVGTDYHRIVREKLSLFTAQLKGIDPEGQYQFYVDNSPFSEKHVALRSNLGSIMKNGLFYSEKYGSRCYIGIILTNRPMEFFQIEKREKQAVSRSQYCLKCKACETACPGNAIHAYGVNSYRCVSYLTQKKEALTEEESKALGIQIYGCDFCQKVCPLNDPVPNGFMTGAPVDLNQLLNMTNKEFKQAYGQTAAGWRGKKVLQRNAVIAMKNIMESD